MAQQSIPKPALANPAVSVQRRWATFVQGLFFVAGFGTFVIGFFGLVGTFLGDVLYDAKDIVRIVGGVALILFGLFTMKIVNIPILYSDTRRQFGGVPKGVSGLQSYITGVSFAAGWTPCIGPFLGAILTLSVEQALGTRLALLTAYTLGLGIPFLLFALLFDRMTPLLKALKRNMRTIEIVSGLLLIAIGVAVLSGKIADLSRGLANTDFDLSTMVLGQGSGGAPSIIVAAVAGFLSFVSPCVLPLLPAYLGFIGGWTLNNAVQE